MALNISMCSGQFHLNYLKDSLVKIKLANHKTQLWNIESKRILAHNSKLQTHLGCMPHIFLRACYCCH